jgi:transposase
MELDCEMWVGDAARIATMRVRKQKTDRQDAQLLLKLMIEDRFPRVWISGLEDRDLHQLLWHRYRTVQMRTRILDQLQSIAMNEGISDEVGFGACKGASDWNRFHSDLGEDDDEMICLFC